MTINFIKENHQFKANVTKTSRGALYYGYKEPVTNQTAKITEKEAQKKLEEKLASFDKIIKEHVKVELNKNQTTALKSLLLDIKEVNFKYSKLLQCLNDGKTVTQSHFTIFKGLGATRNNNVLRLKEFTKWQELEKQEVETKDETQQKLSNKSNKNTKTGVSKSE